MKIKHLFVAIIAIAALYLSACQKELNPDDIISRVDSTSNPTVGDSVYLDSYYYIEINSSGLNGFDTGERRHYQYDNLKRVVSIMDTSNEPFYHALMWYDKELYFYNGIDSLPFKRINYHYRYSSSLLIPSIKDTVISYINYNSNGKIILDSSIQFGLNIPGSNFLNKYINKFSYNGNKIFQLKKKTNLLSSNDLYYKDTMTLDIYGNIVNSRGDSSSNVSYTYDNKLSPISNLNIKQFYYFSFYGNNLNSVAQLGFTPINNILTIHEVSNFSTYDDDYTNSYSYNLNGYPFLSLINYTGQFPYTDKHIFNYKSL